MGRLNTPHSNFLRGVKWSPDGACMLVAADDNWCEEQPASPFVLQAQPCIEPSSG